ncbi:MAG TPA: hypothetical protein VLF14_11120 [Candidatus Binatia bacterium]|nr:hypothetical protein [Candidatus Binatia bacterium]
MRNTNTTIVRGASALAGFARQNGRPRQVATSGSDLLLAFLGLACLVCVSSASAHGTQRHVLGTVSELDATHLVVKTNDGKSQSILRNTKTKYVHGKSAATADDLKVGDRVVVHASASGDPPTATTIRFSTPKNPGAPTTSGR